jgi:hypothetical protein
MADKLGLAVEMALRAESWSVLPDRFCLPSELWEPAKDAGADIPAATGDCTCQIGQDCQTRANRTLFQILAQNRKKGTASSLLKPAPE